MLTFRFFRKTGHLYYFGSEQRKTDQDKEKEKKINDNMSTEKLLFLTGKKNYISKNIMVVSRSTVVIN